MEFPSTLMPKVIWICWLQGWRDAPDLVMRCAESWSRRNPEWEVRHLDSKTFQRYVELPSLEGKQVTSASLSDLLRVHLLREFGGVWVDATTFCNQPLDRWLPDCMSEGFFAFDAPGGRRPLSSWFLAAHEDNAIVAKWHAISVDYWRKRSQTDDYFWFHHLFGALLENDKEFADMWGRVPKISADIPHSLQHAGMFKAGNWGDPPVDWTAPLFKLTYRLDATASMTGTFLEAVLHSLPEPAENTGLRERLGDGTRRALGTLRRTGALVGGKPSEAFDDLKPVCSFAGLHVSTTNLGDHIQILAARRLLRGFGVDTIRTVDRDNEIGSAASLTDLAEPTGILLNGWFKRNGSEWPPHPRFRPLFLGFHMRLAPCPELLSVEALEYYREHGPIGCRDSFTHGLLAEHDVPSFESHCLTLTLLRRTYAPEKPQEIFVASRDRRIEEILPTTLGPYSYLTQYSDLDEFEVNLQRAHALLENYRDKAALIVTTFLHCALPAIAMGIPVVVFYPENHAAGHASDRERFSSLEQITRVYKFSEIGEVNWRPSPIPVSQLKLDLIDHLEVMMHRWKVASPKPFGPIAESSVLPPP